MATYWDTIDWENRQDIDIAESEGKSRERIRQIRQEGNYPECKNKGRNREKVKFENNLSNLIKQETIIVKGNRLDKTVDEIAALTNRPSAYVARALSSSGFKAKSANMIYNWDQVAWTGRSNKDIAREKQTSPNYVSRQRKKYAPNTVRGKLQSAATD